MYDWLEERKQQARMQRAQQRPTSFVARTMRDRWIDTGFGPDGRLQSDRPTHMLNTSNGPKTVHEGEGMRVDPDGRFAVYTADEMGYMNGRQYAAPYNRRNRFMYECGKEMGHMGGKPYGYMGGKEIGYRRGHEDPDEFLRSIMPAENIGGQTALEDWEKRQIEGSYGYQTGREIGPQTTFLEQSSGASGRNPLTDNWSPTAGASGPQKTIPETKTNIANTPPQIGPQTTFIDSLRGASGRNPLTDNWSPTAGASGPQKTTSFERPVVNITKKEDAIKPATIVMPGPEPEPKTTPAPSLEESGRRLAMGRLMQRATTGSEADRVARQQHLDDLKATLATEESALAQELAQARVSPREARTRLAMAARDRGMAISDAEAASIIADLQSRERAEQTLAAQSLAGMGEERARQQFERTQGFAEKKYADAETQRMASDAKVMDEASFMAKYPNATPEQYAEMRRGMNQIDESGRIGTLFTGGRGLSDMKADQQLRNSIASRLGVPADDPAVDNEIDTLYNSYMSQNRSAFEGNFEGLISAYVADNASVDSAIADQEVYRSAAGALGLDPLNPENAAAIQDEIRRRYDLQSRPDVDVFYDNMMASGAWADLADTPTFENDAKKVIAELIRNGSIVNGEIVDGENIDWPWNNPESYFRYNTWDNKDMKYVDGKIPPEYWTQTINVGGEQYLDSDGKPITYAMAQAKWMNLGELEKEKYFKDGKVDVGAFVQEMFPKQETPDGELIPQDQNSIEQGVLDNNEELEDIVSKYIAGYGGGVYPPGYKIDGMELPAGTPMPSNQFLYTAPDGTKEVGNLNMLKGIIYQFSNQFNDGNMMEAGTFATRWNDGNGYVVDENGIVKNFNKEYQEEHGLKSESGYRLTDKKAEEISFEGDVTPVEQPPATGDINIGYTGFETITGKGEGTMHSTLVYNSAAYDAVPGDRKKVDLKPELSAWARNNAGKTMYYDGKVYKIDKSEPVVYDTIYDSVGEYSQPYKVQGIKVVDENGVEKIITFGAKGELMDKSSSAEGREAALKKFIPNFEGEELRNQLASIGYQSLYDDYALFSNMKTQPVTEENEEIATTAMSSALRGALRGAL